MTEEVRWTPLGKAALAETHGEMLRDAKDADLRAAVVKDAKEFAPRWKRGLAKADAEGKAAVALAAPLIKGQLPKKLTIDDAARLLSLFGADGSEHVGALGELVIRKLGLEATMAVLARMWSHRTTSDHPDWPKITKRSVIYIEAIDDDDDHVHDASCSYAKAAFTRYLERRFRASPAAERAAMKKGVTAIWKKATPHARPALAVATRDAKRAKASALELIDAGLSPYPYFAWDHLPYLIDDAKLVFEILGDGETHIQLIDTLGTAIWQRYADTIGGNMDGQSRARILGELANFYGPKTALIIAEYEDTKLCREVVRDYFTRYPELLHKIIDEPSLQYHRDDLLKLTSSADKPARVRPLQ
jgi:hypothetical protein